MALDHSERQSLAILIAQRYDVYTQAIDVGPYIFIRGSVATAGQPLLVDVSDLSSTLNGPGRVSAFAAAAAALDPMLRPQAHNSSSVRVVKP